MSRRLSHRWLKVEHLERRELLAVVMDGDVLRRSMPFQVPLSPDSSWPCSPTGGGPVEDAINLTQPETHVRRFLNHRTVASMRAASGTAARMTTGIRNRLPWCDALHHL